MIFRNSPMIFTINTNSKIEAFITFLTYKSSTKDIDDSLYWDHTMIKYRNSMPMDISYTEIYYTHQPILNPYSSNKRCKWFSFWYKLLMKTTKIWDNDRYWLPQQLWDPNYLKLISEAFIQNEEVQEVKISCQHTRSL